MGGLEVPLLVEEVGGVLLNLDGDDLHDLESGEACIEVRLGFSMAAEEYGSVEDFW